jgi:exopolysaccharide biosynthesis polyprenyl glycosylphosphotransferase
VSQLEAIDFRVARPDDARAFHPFGAVRRRGWLIRRALLSADLLALASAFAIAVTTAGHGFTFGDPQHRAVELTLAALAVPLWMFAAKLYGLYDRDEERTDHSTLDELVAVFHLVTSGAWIFFVVGWFSGIAEPNLRKLVLFWFAATCLVTGYRAVARGLCRHHSSYVQNTIIVGAGEIGQLVARKLLQHPEYGINLVGFVDAEPRERHEGMEHVPLLGSPDDLADACTRLGVERVVVAFSRQDARETLNVIRSLRELDVQIDLVPRLFEILGPSATMHSVEGVPLVGLSPVRLTRSSRFIKRLIDIVGASLLLVLTAPLFLALAIWVRRSSSGPVFFTQRRLGFEMNEFTTIKFRTMHVGADESAHRDYIRATMNRSAAPGAEGFYKLLRPTEITSVGRFLRKTSLDELPQLINVLRGEMSLVGPRPCIAYETEFFEPHHFERFLVPQGLTGLWQVTARARSTFAEALDMDVAYARSWSLELDLKILFKTPLQLFRLKGSA